MRSSSKATSLSWWRRILGAPSAISEPLPRRQASDAWAQQRAEARARIETVVRDAMVRAGVLSSQYRFKTLASDRVGSSYIVLIDLAAEADDLDVFARNEWASWIGEKAVSRFGIEVPSVYWRKDDPSRANLSRRVRIRTEADHEVDPDLSATKYGELA